MKPLLTGVKQRVISFMDYWPVRAPAIEFMLIVVFPYTLLTSLKYRSSIVYKQY